MLRLHWKLEAGEAVVLEVEAEDAVALGGEAGLVVVETVWGVEAVVVVKEVAEVIVGVLALETVLYMW